MDTLLVMQINLAQNLSETLPFESPRQIHSIAVSPNGTFLLTIDESGKSMLINNRWDPYSNVFSQLFWLGHANTATDSRGAGYPHYPHKTRWLEQAARRAPPL